MPSILLPRFVHRCSMGTPGTSAELADAPALMRWCQAADPTPSTEAPFGSSRLRRETIVPAEEGASGPGVRTRRGLFRAGSLVWIKLNLGGWWPGKVLDPSSERAREARTRPLAHQSILVAYFGDGAVTWFEPARVKPFEEDLLPILSHSSSTSFAKAVKDALFEMEKGLIAGMSCHCWPDSKCDFVELGCNFRISNYLPDQFHDRLLDAAVDSSGVGMLDVVLLRSWALALRCRTERTSDLAEKDSHNSTWPDLAIDVLEMEHEVSINRVVKGPEISEDSEHKKERSIADIIAGKGSKVAVPCDNMVKVAISDKFSPLSSKSELQKANKIIEKRKSSDVENITTWFQDEKAVGLDQPDSSSLSSKMQTRKGMGNLSSYTTNGALVERETRSSGRERKRSKYLSPPYEVGYDKRSPFLYEIAERAQKDCESSQLSFAESSRNLVNIAQVAGEGDGQFAALSCGGRSSPDEIFTEFLLAAAGHLCLKLNQSTEAFRDFFSKFRSSTYSEGSDFLGYQKLLNNLSCKGEQSIDNHIDNNSAKYKSALKRNRRISSASNEAPISQAYDLNLPAIVGRVQRRKRSKIRHGEAGAQILVATENVTANGRKEITNPQDRETTEISGTSAKNDFDLHSVLKNSSQNAVAIELPLDTRCGLADQSVTRILGRKRKKMKSECNNSGTTSDVEHNYTCISEESGSKQKMMKKEETNCRNPSTGIKSSQLQTSTLKTPLPYVRKGLERMISKLTGYTQDERDVESSNKLSPEITGSLVLEMDSLLKKVNKLLSGPSAGT